MVLDPLHEGPGLVQRLEAIHRKCGPIHLKVLQRFGPVPALPGKLDEKVVRLVLRGIDLHPVPGQGQGPGRFPYAPELPDLLTAKSAMEACEPETVTVYPVLEGAGDREAPPLQEGATVEREGEGKIPSLRGGGELQSINRHPRRDLQVLTRGPDPILPQLLAEAVEGLAQRVAGTIGRLLGPEETRQDIPGDPALDAQA
jgi:hypothetical protein